jgi:hypothetical protein
VGCWYRNFGNELMDVFQQFLQRLNQDADKIVFNDTMAVVDALYDFTPTDFTNGEQVNKAGENNGSCKLFAFAQLNNLSPEQTLACFGQFYREDVLQHPEGSDHQNIRNFIKFGWQGISFEQMPLTSK